MPNEAPSLGVGAVLRARREPHITLRNCAEQFLPGPGTCIEVRASTPWILNITSRPHPMVAWRDHLSLRRRMVPSNSEYRQNDIKAGIQIQ